MSFLKQLAPRALRNLRPRASEHQSFWSPGKQERVPGYLFGETPLPPGESRKWETWELPWYSAMWATAIILGIGLPARPNTNITSWARQRAIEELKEEEGES